MRFPPRPGLWLPRLIRFREQLRKSYEQAKEFIGEVEKLKAKVADSYQDFEAGHISQEELGSRLREAITELNELLPENVSERFDAIYPNWESKFLGIREEYLPTENNATSANSEFSPEELAQAYIESLESLADSDFYFLSGVDYIAGSMTDPELDAFVTEMRNLLGTPTPTPNTTSEEIINQIVARVSDGTSVEEIGDILEQIETFNLNPTDIINEIDSRIEKTEPVDPYTAHEHQDTDYNCGPTLVKVISAQHGIDISEGELTLRALLEGDFRLEGRPTIECFEILFGLFSGCSVTPGIDGGTLPRHMGQMFEDLGIPVDYNYSARPVDIEAALAQGKSVIVAVNVGPLWRSQSGGHVLQVLEIKENENVVIVNDTGRDSGAGIEYPLDRFLEACEQYTQGDGIVMITTKEAPPRAVPETPTPTATSNSNESFTAPDGSQATTGNGEETHDPLAPLNQLNGETNDSDASDPRQELGATPAAQANNGTADSSQNGDLSVNNNDERISTNSPEPKTEPSTSQGTSGTEHVPPDNPPPTGSEDAGIGGDDPPGGEI